MVPQASQRNLAYWLSAGIVLFFLGDLMRLVAHELDWSFTRFTGYSKMFYLIILGVLFLQHKRIQSQGTLELLVCIVVTTLSFLAGCALLDLPFDQLLSYNYPYFMRLLYLPLALLVFRESSRAYSHIPLRVVEYLFWINAGIIGLALLFELDLFRTYYPPRFGYKGFYDRNTTITIIALMLSVVYLYGWMHKRNLKALAGLIGVVAVCLILGPKKTLLLPLAVVAFLALSRKRTRTPILITAMVALIVVVLFQEPIVAWLRDFNPLIADLYDRRGLISAVTSLRSDLLQQMTTVFIPEHWSIGNYVTGGGYFRILRTEMDLLDVYFLTGVFGLICTGYVYGKHVIRSIWHHPLGKFFVAVFLFFALVSSGVIYNADLALYLIAFTWYFTYHIYPIREQV